MSTRVKDTDGFTLQGWMVTELHLTGGDLVAFALVYQFAMSSAGLYKGNTAYISAWTGWSERTSRAHLIALLKRGLIAEVRGRKNNSPFCYYKLGPAFYEVNKSTPQKKQGEEAKKVPTTMQIHAETPCKKCGENILNDSTSEYMPLSCADVATFCRSRGWADPEGFAAYYCSYHDYSGWRMNNGRKIVNWKLNVISWEPNNKTRIFSTPKASADTRFRQMRADEFSAFLKE